MTQDVNCAQTLASKNAFSPLVLSCRISNFSPIQTPVPRHGLQTISPVAFILQVAWLQGGTNFPMQSGDLSKVQSQGNNLWVLAEKGWNLVWPCPNAPHPKFIATPKSICALNTTHPCDLPSCP